jgi:predicted hydrocarbon binding protein
MSGNPILDEMVYDPLSGTLRFKGVRYLLIRPETITGFQKTLLKKCGNEADTGLFEGGFSGGRLSTEKYRDIHSFSDTEIIDFMMNMGNQIGWGNFTLEHYDPVAEQLDVVVRDSAFARAYGQSTGSVCHLIRGVLAGMASVLFAGECIADEVECQARGDERCRFEIKGKGKR